MTFHIAQDPVLRLIQENITWEQFYHFASPLMAVADKDVRTLRVWRDQAHETELLLAAPASQDIVSSAPLSGSWPVAAYVL